MFESNPIPPHLRNRVPEEVSAPKTQPGRSLDWDVPDDEPAAGIIEQPSLKISVAEVPVPWIDMPELPSQFRAYPEGTKIKFRPYTFGEIEAMSSGSQGMLENYQTILDGIMVTGMDKLDLTLGDFTCISMYRKFYSMGTQEVVISFDYEGQTVSHVMSVQNLSFDDLEVDLPIILPVSSDRADLADNSLEFMPVTVGKYLEYQRLPQQHKIDSDNVLLALSCTNQTFEDALTFIMNATGANVQYLAMIDTYLYHGISDLRVPIKVSRPNPAYAAEADPELRKAIAPQITEVVDYAMVEVKEDSLLILPFRRPDETAKGGLRFGRGGNR